MIKALLIGALKDCGGAMVSMDPFLHLKQHGYAIEPRYSIDPSYDDILWADLVFIHRGHLDVHYESALNAKRLGKKIWTELDDDLLNMPTDHFAYTIYQNPKMRSNIVRILELADVVSYTSLHLLERYSKLNPNCFLLYPSFDERILNAFYTPSEKRNKTISWRGSPTHMRSLMEFADAIVEVENKHPGWHWEFIGQNPWFITDRFINSTVTITPWIEPMQFFEKLCGLKPAVHFSALTDNPFTKARSNLAYIDATMAGAVLLAPDWDHFKRPQIVNYQQKNKADFVQKFSRLLTHFEEGKNYNHQVNEAWNYILNHMTFKQSNEKRAEILEELFHRKDKKRGHLCVSR